MAWIKLDHLTPDKPEVIGIAAALGIDQDAALGKLARVWIWADQQAIAGNAVGNAIGNAKGNALVTAKMFIDRCACHRGFADAMIEVGWLDVSSKGVLSFPNFDRHNGQTAKQRALTARRVAKHKESKNGEVTPEVTPEVTDEALPTALPEALLLRNQEREREDLTLTSHHKRCALGGSDLGSSAKDLVSVAECEPIATKHFRRMGYSGDDCAIVWKATAAFLACRLPESVLVSAVEGTAECANGDKMSYFRRVLENKAAESKIDLRAILKSVQLDPKCPTTSKIP